MILLAALIMAQARIVGPTSIPRATPAQESSALAAARIVAPGMIVRDLAGNVVGTVLSSSDAAVVIDTGTTKAAFAPSSFTPMNGGLMFTMSRADVEAMAQKQLAELSAARAPLLKPGTRVVDRVGSEVGTVSAVEPGLVTVSMATGAAKLPVEAFVVVSGVLGIGMTLGELQRAVAVASVTG